MQFFVKKKSNEVYKIKIELVSFKKNWIIIHEWIVFIT